MNKSEDIIAAWGAAIWIDPTITAITTNVFPYDVLASIKESGEAMQLRDSDAVVNFFTLLVTRTRNTGEIRNSNTVSLYEFDVEIAYHLEKDTSVSSTNHNQATAALEDLDDVVMAALGGTWIGTISFYQQTGILKPRLIQIDERDVWQTGYSYKAVKSVSI